MILPGYQTSDSASSSKFHHLALLALLVALVSHSSNFHHWPLLALLVVLVFIIRVTQWILILPSYSKIIDSTSSTSWRVDWRELELLGEHWPIPQQRHLACQASVCGGCYVFYTHLTWTSKEWNFKHDLYVGWSAQHYIRLAYLNNDSCSIHYSENSPLLSFKIKLQYYFNHCM